jgi:hypothetical protein
MDKTDNSLDTVLLALHASSGSPSVALDLLQGKEGGEFLFLF